MLSTAPRIALATVAVAAGVVLQTELGMAADRLSGRGFVTRSPAVGRSGMAATSQPLATLAAVDTLRAGGNAIDAVIAANAVLCVTEPTGCGLGGDLFAIVWHTESQRLFGLNGSGRSPQGLTLDEFRRRGLETIPPYGPLPVSVPGCVDGWATLHERFGKLPLERVLAPAIRQAEEGFAVNEVIAGYWAGGVAARKDQPGFAEVFLPDGRPPAHGDTFRNPSLAATLKKIAAGGAAVFYRGPIAKKIDAFMRQSGGFLRYDDLADHRSEWVEPVGVDYRGYRVWELPPNGQGIAALQILQLLKGHDLASAGFGSADHLHYFIEAKRLAFEDRARYYADPAFAPAPVERLISDEYADERRALIDPDRAADRVMPGDATLSHGDTVYLTTADSERNMVSLIQSNYRGFGSGMCPPGLGFCLQDRGELFDLTPGRPNSYEPGKRPFHTIIPAMVTKDGKPVMSFGVMGGDMQPQGHAQIVMNRFDFGMGLQEAGDAPRIRHGGSSTPTGLPADGPGQVYLESGFGAETVEELTRRGHRVTKSTGGYGGYQAIWYDADQDIYYGATESRKDGVALGY